MNNKKNILLLVLGCIVTSLTANAQDSWNTMNPVHYEATSLAIAPDARAAGLGDVGAATDPDVNSQYWNPAKYPFCISRAGVALNYTPWLRSIVDGIDLANLTGYIRLGDYNAISGSLRYFSLGEVMVSGTEDIIRPYEMAVDVAYSRMLSETFSASVGLRFIYSDMTYRDDESRPGSAFASDIAMYHNGYINVGQRECQLSWGLNISNIGSKISFNEGLSNNFIPTNMRLGAALLIPVDEYNSLTIAADANKLLIPTMPTYKQFLYSDAGDDAIMLSNANYGNMSEAEKEAYKASLLSSGKASYYSEYSNWLQGEGYNNVSPISGIFKSFGDAPNGFKEELQEVQWSIGAEYSYNNQFFLRAGYHYEHPNKGNRKYFTLGAGFKMNVFSIDAGYVISTAQSNPLDQTLRFSLAFDMDGIQDILGKRRR